MTRKQRWMFTLGTEILYKDYIYWKQTAPASKKADRYSSDLVIKLLKRCKESNKLQIAIPTVVIEYFRNVMAVLVTLI